MLYLVETTCDKCGAPLGLCEVDKATWEELTANKASCLIANNRCHNYTYEEFVNWYPTFAQRREEVGMLVFLRFRDCMYCKSSV